MKDDQGGKAMQSFDDLLSISKARPETIPFARYLERVAAQPRLAATAHQRLRAAIHATGVEVPPQAEDSFLPRPRRFGLFRGEIFGIDEVLEKIVRVIESAADGQDTRRRILLLVGPPGSAKSTIASLLKRALERYSATDEGALYGIAGCPLHEEPLHLLSHEARLRFRERTGVVVEGDLCPVCRYRLDHDETWQDLGAIPVERVILDESRRVGIATCSPSDPDQQDVSDLVGSMDLVQLQRYGSESHPLAFDFSGALDVGNRGLVELIEWLKLKPEMLYVLLTVAQEQRIKTGRFALISCDEVLLAHCNYEDLTRFLADKTNAAIADRVIRIDVPYNLSWSAEEDIYRKMDVAARPGLHIAPWTLRVAAAVAILSRLQPDTKYDELTRLKLYDGQLEGVYTEYHVEEAHRLAPHDGLGGISPRQVVNALAQAAAKAGTECLTPPMAMRALRDSYEHHLTSIGAERLAELVGMARAEYDVWAEKMVSRAFIGQFEAVAQDVLEKYLDNAYAFLDKEKVRDPITGELRDPNERFLREIEQLLDISPASALSFREEICRRAGHLAARGRKFQWDSHPRLKDGIERYLLHQFEGTIRTTIRGHAQDEEQHRRLEGVKRQLIERHGFCPYCAEEILEYVGELTTRK